MPGPRVGTVSSGGSATAMTRTPPADRTAHPHGRPPRHGPYCGGSGFEGGARVRYEVTVNVAAAPERVWAVLADVEGWPRWTVSKPSVRLLSDGPVTVGSEAEVRQPRLKAEVWEVTAAEAGRTFEWRTQNPAFTTIGTYRIEPLGADRCRVVLGVHQKGILAPLLALPYGKLTRRYVEIEAAGLKRFCETQGR
ncbi:SRPBCC family protein [Kitasatospora sp. NPDC059571]|uniref:SRPBCC family protein n=1 Tax=Kitasatospora sp. NPDC059571 TaxID=3346871 RepID=UPI0036B2B340